MKHCTAERLIPVFDNNLYVTSRRGYEVVKALHITQRLKRCAFNRRSNVANYNVIGRSRVTAGADHSRDFVRRDRSVCCRTSCEIAAQVGVPHQQIEGSFSKRSRRLESRRTQCVYSVAIVRTERHVFSGHSAYVTRSWRCRQYSLS